MQLRALFFALSRSKTGPLLVAAQVTLAFAVIVNLSYLTAHLLDISSRPTGMDLQDMFWLSTQPKSGTLDQARFAAAVKADLAWLNGLPGVVAATTAAPLPQSRTLIGLPVSANPHDLERADGGQPTAVYMGDEHFLDAMGLTLIAGRNFKPDAVRGPGVTPKGDSPANMQSSLAGWAPEVIITQELAQALFPHEPAVGKTLHAGLVNKPAVIVGIVKLFRANAFETLPDSVTTRNVIVPIIPVGPNGVYVVRTQPGRRDELMRRVAQELGDRQPNRFISRIEAYDVTAARSRSGTRTIEIIFSTIATLVLLVTVVGIVGLAAFNLAARSRQLGTRRALGARRHHILGYFLVEHWLITTIGMVPGSFLAMAAGVLLSRVLQMPQLPLYYLLGGALLLWLAGLLAVLIPALRAASTSPAIATRMV